MDNSNQESEDEICKIHTFDKDTYENIHTLQKKVVNYIGLLNQI